MKRYICLCLINLLILFQMSCCTWLRGYGKLGLQDARWDRITIETLEENWQDYTVYYAGLSPQSPSAIMFDPKSDERKLVSEKWVLIKDKDIASEVIHWIKADIQFPPTLYKMLGSGDQCFGYIFTAWHHVHMKVLDENTLWVDDLPLPPFDYRPGRAGPGTN